LIKKKKKTINSLKVQLEEAKKIEKSLERELESNKAREYLEAEIVSLRKEAQRRNVKKNFANSSKALDELISN